MRQYEALTAGWPPTIAASPMRLLEFLGGLLMRAVWFGRLWSLAMAGALVASAFVVVPRAPDVEPQSVQTSVATDVHAVTLAAKKKTAPKFVRLATSETHTLALTRTGVIYGWGSNDCGVLGTGKSSGPKYRPTKATGLKGIKFKQVAVGDSFSVGLSTKGVVYTWGCNGARGALGTGKKSNSVKPVKPKLPKGVKITSIAAGPGHVLALASNGSVYAWGSSDSDRWGPSNGGRSALGDGTTKSRKTPVKVKFPKGVIITWITAGRYYSAARDAVGNMWAWGMNEEGQLGVPGWKNGIDRSHSTKPSKLYTTPVKMQAPEGVSLIEVASNSLEALGSDGNIYTWGLQASGLFGDGTRKTPADYPITWDENPCCGWMTYGIYPTPRIDLTVQRPAGLTFAHVGQHGVPDQTGYSAIGSDGYVYAWGQNYGSLGDGTRTDRKSPVRVKTPKGVKIVQTVASGCHAFALGSNGTIYAWGTSCSGGGYELGIGKTNKRYKSPVTV